MPDAQTVDTGNVLSILLLCGLMGLFGQGIRAAVGLRSALGAGATQQTTFNAAYFFLSLMIGFIAGILAGIAIGLGNFTKINLGDIKVLLGIAAAGYAGADFIENTFSIVIPDTTTPKPPLPTPPAGADSANFKTISDRLNALIGSVSTLRDLPAAAPAPVAAAVPPFADALHTVAPHVDMRTWTAPLTAGFSQFGLTNDRRIAAAVGQFLVEAGDSFQELVENMRYTTAARLVKIFPNEFPTESDAEPYVNNPEALGNKVYANRLGNGDEASGDGYRFRGRGLIQLTGRNEYSEFAAAIGMTAEQASDYCETPAGAAISGCWYLSSRGCLPFADRWDLASVTRLVNGRAMTDHPKRVAFSNAMLRALGGS